MLTQERLKEEVGYSPETGIFTRINGDASQAGSLHTTGYRHIRICGKHYKEHRLAFLYMNGRMPESCDHINRIKHDNRWINLRPATKSQNNANSNRRIDNTSGYKGVYYHKLSGKWHARVSVDGERIDLGLFDCKHEAFCEYVLASRKHHGEFSAV